MILPVWICSITNKFSSGKLNKKVIILWAVISFISFFVHFIVYMMELIVLFKVTITLENLAFPFSYFKQQVWSNKMHIPFCTLLLLPKYRKCSRCCFCNLLDDGFKINNFPEDAQIEVTKYIITSIMTESVGRFNCIIHRTHTCSLIGRWLRVHYRSDPT